MTDLFNNREVATGIWLVVAIFFGARNRGIREVSGNVLKSFWHWKLVVPAVLMVLHVTFCVFLL